MNNLLPLIYAFSKTVKYSRDGVAFNVSLKEFIITVNKVSLILYLGRMSWFKRRKSYLNYNKIIKMDCSSVNNCSNSLKSTNRSLNNKLRKFKKPKMIFNILSMTSANRISFNLIIID